MVEKQPAVFYLSLITASPHHTRTLLVTVESGHVVRGAQGRSGAVSLVQRVQEDND